MNKYTAEHAYLMINLKKDLHMINGFSVFENFNLSHVYWKLHLAHYSKKFLYFITPDGVYSPTRVQQGSSNSVAHPQAALATILNTVLTKKLLVWLDDKLLYERNIYRLLDVIEALLVT